MSRGFILGALYRKVIEHLIFGLGYMYSQHSHRFAASRFVLRGGMHIFWVGVLFSRWEGVLFHSFGGSVGSLVVNWY